MPLLKKTDGEKFSTHTCFAWRYLMLAKCCCRIKVRDLLLTLNGTLLGELPMEKVRGLLGNVPQGSVNGMHLLQVSI